MFTGIIDHCGDLLVIKSHAHTSELTIACQFDSLKLGESIAVDGTCLTVTDIQPKSFTCELSPETLRLTLAKQYQIGRRLNLERALCVGDRLGGHWVSGHIDKTVVLVSKQEQGESLELTFGGMTPEDTAYLIKKGSIALNGVSLTINEIRDDGFTVMLIPHTSKTTNLNQLAIGQFVNLEFDLMAKMVKRQMNIYWQESIHAAC